MVGIIKTHNLKMIIMIKKIIIIIIAIIIKVTTTKTITINKDQTDKT